MKKYDRSQRQLVLHKDTLRVLATRDLDAAVGGVDSKAVPTVCLTVRTCASFEFAC